MRSLSLRLGFAALPPLVALLLVSGVVLAVGQPPLTVFATVWEGAFSSARTVSGVLNFWTPLALACIGLVVTFRAGLWNIGIEGQITMGAICATGVALFPPDLPSPLILALALGAGALGGALWALLAGLLKTRLGVHEIFGGTALNALANVASIYLISTAWLPPEGGSAQGTRPFPATARLPALEGDFAVSPAMLGIVVVLAVVVFAALAFTRWGLQLRATGANTRSALLLGVPVERTMLTGLVVCGALAGLAGAFRVLFIYNNLRPLVSGGIGFLGLLVILLAGTRPLWVLLIAFAFASIIAGSTRLRLSLQLDPSLAGVLQGTLVLVALFAQGVRERVMTARGAAAFAPSPPATTPTPVSAISETEAEHG